MCRISTWNSSSRVRGYDLRERERERESERRERYIYIYIYIYGNLVWHRLGHWAFTGWSFGVSTEVRVRIRAGGYDRNELGALATKSTIARLHIPYHHIYIYMVYI